MNASLQQPNVAVLLNNTILQTSLAYNTPTSYVSQLPGGYVLHVEPSGSSTALINQPVLFQPANFYTIIAAEAAFASPTLAAIVLTDDNSAPSSGNMKLRIVNASPDFGNLDAYAVAPGSSIQSATPTISNLPFESASAYQGLAAGTYQVYFTLAGQKNVIVNSGTLNFTAGQIRTIVLLDSASGYTATVLPDLN